MIWNIFVFLIEVFCWGLFAFRICASVPSVDGNISVIRRVLVCESSNSIGAEEARRATKIFWKGFGLKGVFGVFAPLPKGDPTTGVYKAYVGMVGGCGRELGV